MQRSGPDLVWTDAPLCLKAGRRVGLHPCHQRVGLGVLLGQAQQLQAGAQQLEVVLQGIGTQCCSRGSSRNSPARQQVAST